MAIEQVPMYETAFTRREVAVLLRILEDADGPGVATVKDHIEWLQHGIVNGDEGMSPIARNSIGLPDLKGESPGDFE